METIEIMMIMFGILVGLVLGLPFLALALARLNLFWTIVEEGQAKIVLLNGQFNKALLRYKGFYMDEKWYLRKERREKNGKPPSETGERRKKKSSSMTKFLRRYVSGGLAWVGMWPFYTVYNYDLRWHKLERSLDEKGNAKKEIKKYDEHLDYTFVKATSYFAKLDKAETRGRIPLNIQLVLTIRITNPHRALFRTHQWYEFTIDMLLPHIRAFVGNNEFEDLIILQQLKTGALYHYLEDAQMTPDQEKIIRETLKREGLTGEEIEREVEERKSGIIGILQNKYGIDVMNVNMETLDPANDSYAEAYAKEKMSELEVKRIHNINEKIREFGEQALVVRYLEAIEKVGTGSSNTILPLGLNALIKDIKILKEGG